MAIGKELKRQLTMQGKTVAWLSRETNIPATTIRSIIARDSWSIKPEQLYKICSSLNIETDALLKTKNKKDSIEKEVVKYLLDKQDLYIREISSLDTETETKDNPEPVCWEINMGNELFVLSNKQLEECVDKAAQFFEFSIRETIRKKSG